MNDYKYTNKMYSKAFNQQIDLTRFIQSNPNLQPSTGNLESIVSEINRKELPSNFEFDYKEKSKAFSTERNSRNLIKNSWTEWTQRILNSHHLNTDLSIDFIKEQRRLMKY